MSRRAGTERVIVGLDAQRVELIGQQPRRRLYPTEIVPRPSHCLKTALKVVAQHVKPARGGDDEPMRLRPMLAIVAATITLAAPARADDSDQAFLADLDTAGIHYSDPDKAVAAGKTVCSLKDNGMTNDDVVTNLTQQNPGFAQEKAANFATIATNDYCPQNAGGGAPSS